MPKFRVIVHGVNFHFCDEDAAAPRLIGFFINAFVETCTPEEAENQAIELVRTSPKLRPMVANPPDDHPLMFVKDMFEIPEWPKDSAVPLSGFAFYEDPDAEWRKEYAAD